MINSLDKITNWTLCSCFVILLKLRSFIDKIDSFGDGQENMEKITPFLWFDDQAEEAATFYTSIFKNSRILSISRYSEGAPRPAGSVMVVTFQLNGQEVMALNGGPEFKFSEAFSFFVECESQEDIDHYWESLSAGGEKGPCGWLKDKFGFSWQITPSILNELMNGPDPEKSRRVTQALLKMGKIDIAELQRAYHGD